ncbi:coiled-coil domain-containing protein 167 isoform X1 [Pleuronectes platessa]|uniref:coiled-coil domain-containing protein 167 isoform X1 n=1 Tax=Pleuronectes platessa TaxID=8262 RepID=UPI00232A2B7E|nr:coiled-coil domain-containing protein 167 isoform X1 [Pleuronectes platessa]
MSKLKDKRREKTSVASEIDRLEERRTRCHDNLERAEFKSRKEQLSERERLLIEPSVSVSSFLLHRQELEDEMGIMNERVQKLDKELKTLRGENRRNMVLSVALLAISALVYYMFVYMEEDS